ncbi:MAG: MgtC/SapB family protein [Nanopusillaceae archaeon]
MESLLIKYLVTFLVGLVFGVERELRNKPAGMRTHILVSLGSLTFTLIAIEFFGIEAARIVANIIVGIGFIGAGTILRLSDEKIVGLTTAASLWLTSAISAAIGLGYYLVAILSTIFGIITLLLKPLEYKLRKIKS